MLPVDEAGFNAFKKLIFEDANRLLLALNALSLDTKIYTYLSDRVSNGFITDAVTYVDLLLDEQKISEENYRAIMFILTRIHSLEEVA